MRTCSAQTLGSIRPVSLSRLLKVLVTKGGWLEWGLSAVDIFSTENMKFFKNSSQAQGRKRYTPNFPVFFFLNMFCTRFSSWNTFSRFRFSFAGFYVKLQGNSFAGNFREPCSFFRSLNTLTHTYVLYIFESIRGRNRPFGNVKTRFSTICSSHEVEYRVTSSLYRINVVLPTAL